jgi:hypothetical protein
LKGNAKGGTAPKRRMGGLEGGFGVGLLRGGLDEIDDLQAEAA